jgi:hypothetical protein
VMLLHPIGRNSVPNGVMTLIYLRAGVVLIVGIIATLSLLVWLSDPYTPTSGPRSQIASVVLLSTERGDQMVGSGCSRLTSTHWKRLRSETPVSKRLYRYAKRVASCGTLLKLARSAVKRWLGSEDSGGRRGQGWFLGVNWFGDTRVLVVEYHRHKAHRVYVVK